MAHAARALGLGVMLGCMIESGPRHRRRRQVASLCDHVDLDGNLLLAEDPGRASSFVDGVQLPADEPGLGVGSATSFSLRAIRRPASREDRARGDALRARGRRSDARLDPGRGDRRGDPRRRRRSTTRLLQPTTALVGVATAGGRFPPAWRELLRSCVSKGLDVENGLHEFLIDDPELVELARATGSSCATCGRRAGLNVPTGANLELPAGSCSRSAPTARSGR